MRLKVFGSSALASLMTFLGPAFQASFLLGPVDAASLEDLVLGCHF
jgi:hypothetical protein